MQCFLSSNESQHQPTFFLARGRVQSSPESSQRAAVLQQALAATQHTVVSLDNRSVEQDALAIRAIHDADYLDFLATAWTRWQALPDSTAEVVPNVHPGRNTQYAADAAYCQSDHVLAQAGHYQADTACPITQGTWPAALSSASAALATAEVVSQGHARVAYALCRPPGHHAYADQAGGFCYLNNSAIAAQHLLDNGARRVAVLDVDVHHGNGTQGIFYARDDVFTVSLHGDPAGYYPFFAGHAIETGVDAGAGLNLNVPLPKHTPDDSYLPALEQALVSLRSYAPDALVVALGLDASGDDPLAFLNISTQGFARMGAAIGQLNLPSALIQEGGYLSDILGRNLVSFLQGFESTHGQGAV